MTYIGIKRKMASAFRRLKKIVVIVVKISSLILIF